jgi:hypothetical protein
MHKLAPLAALGALCVSLAQFLYFAFGLCPNSGGGGTRPPRPTPELHYSMFMSSVSFVSFVLRDIYFHIKILLDFLYIAILSQSYIKTMRA